MGRKTTGKVIAAATGSAARLVGVKAIAEYLGCTVRTVQRWRAGRGLPLERVGGHWEAVVSKLDQWRG